VRHGVVAAVVARVVAAVALCSLAGCATMWSRDDLDIALSQHHIDLRWGRLENAALRVAPEMRGAFLQAWATRLQTIELQDVEVTGLAMADDGAAADVVVTVTFVDRASMQVRTATLAERWVRVDDGWRAAAPALPASTTPAPSPATPPAPPPASPPATPPGESVDSEHFGPS
jgi:hypothetical protein